MKTISREAEVKLIEALTDIQDNPNEWVSVCFAFSKLLEHYRSEYQLKIAINLINDVVGEAETTVFQSDDATLFVLIQGAQKSLIDKMIFQLRYLFMDDPLAYDADGEENPNFSKTYDLSRSFDDFMLISKGRLTKRIKQKSGRTGSGKSTKEDIPKATASDLEPLALDNVASDSKPKAKSDIKTFNASNLANIERDLQNADLSRVLRRQPICAAVPDTMVRKVFDELYINIAHLRKILGADVDLLSNRWLFKYLTQILDDRMLHLLQRSPTRYLDNPISLNLNIHTLLSNRFAEFDASIKPAVKVSIVIEIQLADLFNDMGAFLTAKDAVQKLGYRVCLDGVTDLSFTQIDRKKLGFDLLKLQWNANITSDLHTNENKELSNAIKECGVNRVILTRCDDRSAIDYGQAMGISLFQGRYLDSLINPKSTLEN